MGFLLADFQLAMAFRSQHGTDRRTDNCHQCIMLPPYEGRPKQECWWVSRAIFIIIIIVIVVVVVIIITLLTASL